MTLSLKPPMRVLQEHARLSGVLEAPDLPTEQNMVFPFSVCYPTTGTVAVLPGQREKSLTTLNLDIHTNRLDLPTDIDRVLAIFEAIKPRIIQDPTLDGTCATVQLSDEQPVMWTFGQMRYAGVDTVGLRLQVRIKQEDGNP